jgi:hypothetical protein
MAETSNQQHIIQQALNLPLTNRCWICHRTKQEIKQDVGYELDKPSDPVLKMKGLLFGAPVCEVCIDLIYDITHGDE